MIRKTAAALAVAAGFLGVIGMAGPAFAGPGNGTPEAGEVVLWKNTGFTGPLRDFDNNEASYPNDLSAPFIGDSSTKVNDNASSIANYDATHYVRAYVDYNYQGAYLQLLPYGVTSGGLSYAYSSLGAFNESLSSHQVAGP
jgi:Peptidase inhibitor family I36